MSSRSWQSGCRRPCRCTRNEKPGLRFMLYYVLDLLERLYHPPGFGIVRYLTARAAAAAVTALVISFWLGPVIIRLLRRHQIGEAAKLEAPKTHLTKAGTPTMGGLIVLSAL